MDRRIYGVETEYGITCVLRGQRRLSPDEVARYLFRGVVQWGRSSNVFLTNGGRLYLDVGSHPEFATPECDSFVDACLYDRAGEQILHGMTQTAEERLQEEGIRGTVHLFKNNTDSAGNSYGCHENYLLRRTTEPAELESVFVPFLVTRQLVCGAGKVLVTPRGATFQLSQRAEHTWEGVSSSTTRSRPIINTRDEPHADGDVYRRLHVIVGDSNMSEVSNILKLGTAAVLLRMLESPDVRWPDLTLADPIRAIRTISSDVTGRRTVPLRNGREMCALDMQEVLAGMASDFRATHGLDEEESAVLDLWIDVLAMIRSQDERLGRILDWAIKRRVITGLTKRHSCGLDDPRVSALDLMYHDINPSRGVHNTMRTRNLVDSRFSPEQVMSAGSVAPSRTRARLRGRFVSAASAAGADFSVDWVHLKLNDQPSRTVVCRDPFASTDDRVERLIQSLQPSE